MRGAFVGAALAALAAAALGGCAEGQLAVHAAKQMSKPATTSAPAPAPRPGVKVGNPYQIAGVWYYPHDDPNYDETGLASWYGEPFHGRYTANGEVYDMNQVSAAHKTLPLPSWVRVTNLENGRSMVVRVNDRGPFVHGRIIDMSRRGAQLLGFYEKGTARVRVTVVQDADGGPMLPRPEAPSTQVAMAALPKEGVQAESLPPPSGLREQTRTSAAPRGGQPAPVAVAAPREVAVPPPVSGEPGRVEMVAVRATNLFVQAGAFLQFDNANRLSAQLSPLGPSGVSTFRLDGQDFFRVRIGPLQSEAQADAVLERLIAQGHADARIVVD